MDPTCPICADPNRYTIEQKYLESGTGRDTPYTRQEIERHMSHAADPRALRLVTDLANASAVAGRLRALETMAVQIMDAALMRQIVTLADGTQVQREPDLKIALSALREARSTIVEMGKITETLQSQHESDEERPDLDDAIAAYLSGKQIGDLGDLEADEPDDSASPTTPVSPLAIEAPVK
jgi:hypothetical protein